MVAWSRYVAFVLIFLCMDPVDAIGHAMVSNDHFKNLSYWQPDTCGVLAPLINCPDELILQCDEPGQNKKINGWLSRAIASFDMPEDLDIVVRRGERIRECSDHTGIEPVRFTVFNACGDSVWCVSAIRYVDLTPPVFIQLDSVLVTSCLEADNLSPFIVRDNCDSHIFITYTEEINNNGNCADQSITRSWEAQDQCGNIARFVQQVILIDTVPPVPAFVPADKIIYCDDPLEFDVPRFRDECSSVELSIDDQTIYEHCSTTYIRTWTAMDDCENMSKISQRITRLDTVDPYFIELPDEITYFHSDTWPDTAQITVADACGTVTLDFEEITSGLCSKNILRTWTAADECGNISSFRQTLIDTHDVVFDAVIEDLDCIGQPGFIAVTILNEGNYTYAWSNGATAPVINNLDTGTYTLTITDDRGCTTVESFEIQSTLDDMIVVDSVIATTCNNNVGAIFLKVSGGNQPYFYRWSHEVPGTGEHLDRLGPGMYEVTITDQSGCELIHSVTVPYQEKCEGSISGNIWEDLQANGRRDIFDPPVTAISLDLYGEAGVLISSVEPASDGSYYFGGLGSGAYFIRIADIGSFRVGEFGTQNVSSYFIPGQIQSRSIVVSGKIDIDNVHIALYRNVHIGNRVWIDLDGDCKEDGNEVGFGSGTVLLHGKDDIVLAKTSTGEDGFYSFDKFGPGSYYVSTHVPQGFHPCGVMPGSYFKEETGEMRSPAVELLSGQEVPFMDFGLQPSTTCDLNVIVDTKNSTCNLANGEIRLNIIGCAPFTFQWSTGARTKDVSGLRPGVYTCIITDILGTQVVKDIFLAAEDSDLEVELVEFAEPACHSDDGFILIEASGGIGPYQYKWDHGASGTFVDQLAAGIYYVSITDRIGCEEVFEIELPEPSGCLDEDPIDMKLSIILEGPYDEQHGKMISILEEGGYLPGLTPVTLFGEKTEAGQPYNQLPWNYNGTEGTGDFSYPEGFIDWLLITIRPADLTGSSICRRAAMLLEDGSVLFPEGLESCLLNDELPYHLLVEHRNHLMVMTPEPVYMKDGEFRYDFTVQQSYRKLFGSGQKEVAPGVFAMFAGNVDQTRTSSSVRDINFNDILFIQKQSGRNSSYLIGDLDMNGDVNVKDEKLTIENLGRFTDIPR